MNLEERVGGSKGFEIDSIKKKNNKSEFESRHIGPREQDIESMLKVLGYPTKKAFIDAVVPTDIRQKNPIFLGKFSDPLSESQALIKLSEYARKNKVFRSFIGQGYYGTIVPGVLQRNILENPAWYTAYTPYQPEISQGRLEALMNFQQMVSDLTALPIANASLLDEATAAAEAMLLAFRLGKQKKDIFIVADDVFPQTIEVIKTRASGFSIKVIIKPRQDLFNDGLILDNIFGVLVQYPGLKGCVVDYHGFADIALKRGVCVIAATDLLALTLLKPPGEWGASIAVGSSQRFGVPMMYGGPHAAFMAVRDDLKRLIPGRLVGVTLDARGKPALRLALQTREQHIRREKASSNICTAQALLAILASSYAVYHGPIGLKNIAYRIHYLCVYLANVLQKNKIPILNQSFFDTITISTGELTNHIRDLSLKKGMNFRYIDSETTAISLDETTTLEEVKLIIEIFCNVFGTNLDNVVDEFGEEEQRYPSSLIRYSKYLTHPIFNTYHSETSMLRYLRILSDKDLALDRSMIPLGSCTMKLNATAEMMPISWPDFANIHPFAPDEQVIGYHQLIDDLEKMLASCTGYEGVSLQPNAGSQGEYAGLLIIKAFYEKKGESHRNVCLIPASAHGTNPASAFMAGMSVVVVACDSNGNVDLCDLRRLAEQYSARLAAIMITYPSTHGVFEEKIREICEIIHEHGGQVYVDGANLNALLGLAQPGVFGGDVSHLNLHKTFAIPHGGGGPGVGPVAVAKHLKYFLPNMRSVGYIRNNDGISAISAAPYGSAGILPISWMYIAMMGDKGLRTASEIAILSANYIAKKLAAFFPVLYTGKNDLVAHECILDMRSFLETANVTVEDIAKRLIDYGFHAPTMSFPVSGTLMIEPTESESKLELDRFIEAMVSIRAEIKKIEDGIFDRMDNPLKNAPHTADMVGGNEWTHCYSRELAAWPVPGLYNKKYWSPVARVDNVYGDRNLCCSCIPIDERTSSVS